MTNTISSNGASHDAQQETDQKQQSTTEDAQSTEQSARQRTDYKHLQDLFHTGSLAGTHGAIMALLEETVARHRHGDWGDLDEGDKQQNLLAIYYGAYVMSSYVLPHTGVRIWVITEGDRSMTMVLLPDEYQNPQPWGPPTEMRTP